jgi:hypothetical protein
MSATVSKDVMETYRIRNGHDWATIALRTWSRQVNGGADTYYCGEILINSSFGSWAYVWTACGRPFKEFLVDADFDYVFTKFMGTQLRIFDGEATITGLVRKVLDARRRNLLDAEEARELYDAIESERSGMDSSVERYCEGVWRIARDLRIGERHPLHREVFSEPYFDTHDRYDPQPVGFWRDIWPAFTAELKREAESQVQPA